MTRILGRVSVTAVALAIVVLAAEIAAAQDAPGGGRQGGGGGQGRGGGRGRGGQTSAVTVAANPQVQTLIAATDAQKTQITAINEDLTTKRQAVVEAAEGDFAAIATGTAKITAEAEEKVVAALDAAQNTKVLGILVNVLGGPSLTNSQVAKHLKITDPQKTKLEEVAAANRGGGGGGGGRRGMTDEERTAQEKLYTDVLTADQQAEYAKLKAAQAVDEELMQALRPRGRGGRGGGGGGRGGRGGDAGGAGGAPGGGVGRDGGGL